jgi:hypothetical protein
MPRKLPSKPRRKSRFAPKKFPRRVLDAIPLEVKPHWDADYRELRLGNVVIKQLRGRVGIQQMILAVFQEENWPHRIDDPLPRGVGLQLPEERLRDIVRLLNDVMLNRCVRFASCDSGQSISWERE